MTTKKTEKVSVPKLVRITGELHDIFKRGTADVIQIGRLLRLAKEEVGHGEFLPWLEKRIFAFRESGQPVHGGAQVHDNGRRAVAQIRQIGEFATAPVRPLRARRDALAWHGHRKRTSKSS